MFSSGFISFRCFVCVRDVGLQLDGFKIFNVGHDGATVLGACSAAFYASGLLLYAISAVQLQRHYLGCDHFPWRSLL
jgi:hypothetical protein